jgi:SSS family solute:Na+ symporter
LSFGISTTAGIAMTVVFVVLYLWRGGFGAVVKTDAVQFLLMFGSFALLTAWLLLGQGTEVLSSLPESHLDPTGGQPIASILVWYVIALSTLAEPNFFQRAFAAKTPEIARNGLLISIACWLLFDIMTTICGLYARALLPNLENPMYAFPALATEVLPVGLIGIFFAGLFATVLSSLDSNLFTSATTMGRDLWPSKLAPSWSDERKTRLGIVISALLAAGIAWAAGSVISIWKIFGSVSAAALLIPILTTWYPRLKISNIGVMIVMSLSAFTTIAWFAAKPFWGSYPFDLEPLFAGGLVSMICYGIDRIRLWRRGQQNGKSEA